MLEQAKDSRIPLLERVRFLCISCANLDEFFEIRVASLKELQEAGAVQGGPDGLAVPDQLKAIRARAVRLVDEQYQLLNDVLLPELAKSGVIFVSPDTWTEAQALWLADYFSPRGRTRPEPPGARSGPALPQDTQQEPELRGGGRRRGWVRPQQRPRRGAGPPAPLPRLIRLPDELGSRNFVFLGTIVEAFVSKLFAGMNMRGCYQFRVTRNSDLFVEQGRGRRPAARGRGRTRLAPLRRCRAPGDRPRLPRRDSHLPARTVRPQRATIFTRCRVR